MAAAHTCADGGNVEVLLGNGDGTFQSAVEYRSGGYTANEMAMAVADVDGDSEARPARGQSMCQQQQLRPLAQWEYCWATAMEQFQAAVTYGSGGYEATSVAVGDVNGDGKLDLLVANSCVSGSNCTTGTVGVLLGNGDGTFQAAVAYGSGGAYAASVALADVNGDGKPDLLVANPCVGSPENCANGALGVLLGNGDGTFQAASLNAVPPIKGDIRKRFKPALWQSPISMAMASWMLPPGRGIFCFSAMATEPFSHITIWG